MRKKDDNTMHFVNDDLQDDLVDDDSEDLISGVFHDLEMGQEWILICEICLDEFFEDDLDDDEVKFVNEKISKRLSRSVLKIHIYDVKRKLLILDLRKFHEQLRKSVQTAIEDEKLVNRLRLRLE
jgi:hypothetical protein